MKISILTFLFLDCLLTQFIHAQNIGYKHSGGDKIPFCSIGMNVQYAPFVGDNFLSEQYDLHPGIILESRFGLKDIWGFGVSLVKSQVKSYEPEFLGNYFNDIRFRDFGFFLYYQFFFNEKFAVEPQLGFGFLSVKHKHVDYSYNFKLNYRNAFLGINGNFILDADRHLILFGGIRYGRYATGDLFGDITINKDDLPYIRISQRVVTQIGLRWEIYRK